MAYVVHIRNVGDDRGFAGIIDQEDILPFKIKRVLYLYDIKSKRGGHAHKKTIQALICIKGSCEVYTNNGRKKESFTLNSPEKCLILNPEDWHTMENFTKNAVLLVLGSEYYSPDDYIAREPKDD